MEQDLLGSGPETGSADARHARALVRVGMIARTSRIALVACPVVAVVVVATVLLLAQPADRPFLAAAAAIAVAAGVAATSIGVYGGVLVPGILLLGVDPRVAAAMSLLLQVIVIPVGASGHVTFGNVRAGIVRPLLVGGVAGAVLGASLAASVPGALVARVIAAVIVVLGIVMLVSLGTRRVGGTGPQPVRARRIGGIGLVAGFATGISGAGWGPLGVKMLVLSGVETRSAIGSSLVGRMFVAVAGVIAYAIARGPQLLQVNPGLFVVLLAASVAAMLPGTMAISRIGSRRAGMAFALLSIGLAIPTLLGGL